MELQILVSKKGTQVVTAMNLHATLKLPAHKFNKNVDHWLSDYYAFADDIRQPIELQDYSAKKLMHSKGKDFYLSLEMARLICLASASTVKKEIAQLIIKQEVSYQKNRKEKPQFTKDQILAVIELTKVMGMISCQKSAEKEHQKYFGENQQAYNWWKYRAGLLGYSVAELKNKMQEVGKNFKNKNMLKMLFQIDKYEIIRIAVIDLFVALGKKENYAQDMGDMAKIFAREMKVEIWDDRNASLPLHTSDINMGLVSQIKDFNKTGLLNLL